MTLKIGGFDANSSRLHKLVHINTLYIKVFDKFFKAEMCFAIFEYNRLDHYSSFI